MLSPSPVPPGARVAWLAPSASARRRLLLTLLETPSLPHVNGAEAFLALAADAAHDEAEGYARQQLPRVARPAPDVRDRPPGIVSGQVGSLPRKRDGQAPPGPHTVKGPDPVVVKPSPGTGSLVVHANRDHNLVVDLRDANPRAVMDINLNEVRPNGVRHNRQA